MLLMSVKYFQKSQLPHSNASLVVFLTSRVALEKGRTFLPNYKDPDGRVISFDKFLREYLKWGERNNESEVIAPEINL